MHFDQRYDLAIAQESYERLPIESFEIFLPFAEAVADGSVVQRRWISRFTGLERCVETLVTLANGYIWREARGEPHLMPTLEDDGTELRERRFLPYRALVQAHSPGRRRIAVVGPLALAMRSMASGSVSTVTAM